MEELHTEEIIKIAQNKIVFIANELFDNIVNISTNVLEDNINFDSYYRCEVTDKHIILWELTSYI